MGKVLRSLLAIMAILGLVGGSAFAVFSDAATDENRFTSGRVDITIPDDGVWSGDVRHLVPGRQVGKTVVIKNYGNVKFDWTSHSETTGALFEGATPAFAGYQPSQGTLHPNATQAVDVTVQLPQEAGNEYQNKSGTLYIHFEASSSAAP